MTNIMDCIVKIIDTSGESIELSAFLDAKEEKNVDNFFNELNTETYNQIQKFLNDADRSDSKIYYTNGDALIPSDYTKNFFNEHSAVVNNLDNLDQGIINYLKEQNIPILIVDSPLTVQTKGTMHTALGTLINNYIIVSAKKDNGETKSIKELIDAVIHEGLHYAYDRKELFNMIVVGDKKAEENIVTNYSKYINLVDVAKYNSNTSNFNTSNSNTSKDDDVVPFLGQYEDLFEAINLDTTLQFTDKPKFITSVWNTFEESAPISTNNQRNYELYSEQIEITTPIQLQSLSIGDLIKIPSFNRIPKDKLSTYSVDYNNFDNKYFDSAKYYPISRIWKNNKGEVLVSFIAKFGDKGIFEKTLSFTDLKFISDTANKKLEVRKYYGKFIGTKLDLNSDRVKTVKENFYGNLDNSENSVLYLEKGKDGKKHYAIGDKGFKLPLTSELDPAKKILLTELLKPNDVVQISYSKKDNSGETKKYKFTAPIVRAYGNVIEVLVYTSNKEYKLQKYNINNIVGLYLNKDNHNTLVHLFNYLITTDNFIVKESTNTNKYNKVWFNGENSYGNLQTNLDTQAAINFRRRAVKKLQTGDMVAVTWLTDEGYRTSKYLVAGVYGDNVYFYLNPKSNDDDIKIWRVDLKDPFPIKTKNFIKPALAGVYYDNEYYGNSDAVDELDSIRDEINKQFIYNNIDESWSLSEEAKSSKIKTLKDSYSIINIENDNRIEEVSKLRFGDIIKYKTKNGTRIAVVTKSDPLHNILQVTYSYLDKDFFPLYVREDIDINKILYVGFTNKYEAHPDIQYMHDKYSHTLFDLNYSMLNLKSLERAKNYYNACVNNKPKNTEFILVDSNPDSNNPKIVYVVPKDIYEQYKAFNYNGWKTLSGKTFFDGGTIRLKADVEEDIKSGKYKDLTEDFCTKNSQDHLYSVIKQVNSNGNVSTFKFPEMNNYKRFGKAYLFNSNETKTVILPNDIIKIKYRNSEGNIKYTRFLRVIEVTDKGIKLVGEIKNEGKSNLEKDTYTEYSWFISWNKLGSKENFDNNSDYKYCIEEFLYPYTGEESTARREKSLENKTPLEVNKVVSTKVATMDYYDEKILLNKLITKLRDLGLDESKMKIFDNESIKEEIKDNFIKSKVINSGAFLYNGVIYINMDKANIQSPLHELMHIFMGYLRATNKEAYDIMLDRLVNTDKQFVEYYRSMLKTSISDDVKEEAFVEYIARALKGNLLFESTLDNNVPELSALFDRLFFSNSGIELSTSDLQTIGNSKLVDIISYFGTVFRSENKIKQIGNLNSASGTYRKYSNIISKLIRENNLIENC